MGFILTKKSGAVEGKKFVFGDGGEARIGRTHGNDVMICDNETSRHHARVFETDDGCFIEDLGSANGTFVNEEELGKSLLLHSGDVIRIGKGKLIFWNEAEDADEHFDSQEENTVIKSAEELAAEREASSALAVASRAPRQVVRRAPPKPAPIAPSPKRRNPLAKSSPTAAPESAADRARRQRKAQKSFWGRLHYAFLALSPQKRLFAIAGLAITVLFVLLAVVFLIYSGRPRMVQTQEPKLLVVGGQAIQASFGWGKEVTWPNLDSKQFEFHVVSPGRIVAVIRYQAKDIALEEVNLQFNSVSLGYVPADTLDVDTREIEWVVSPQLIRNNEINTILFDNVKNPPEKNTWRIWGIAVEIESVPYFTSANEAREAVAQAITAAQLTYDARNIAPANLYYAWKAYRRAWLIEESLDLKDVSEYEFILSKYREIRVELDKLCEKYILDFRRVYSTARRREPVVRVLNEIIQHFPEPDHRCHLEAKRVLDLL